MQALDAVTLKHLAAEYRTLLIGSALGAKVSKIQHLGKDEFVITFWGGPPRAGNLLYINLSPEFAFCALLEGRQDFFADEFDKPTSFCMLLRKHLGGANVVDIRTLPGERVINFVLENHNELGNKVRLVLSLELMGKHTNMILYDDVQESILGVAHGVSEQMSQYRELAAGLTYAPPPEPLGKRFLGETPESLFVQELTDIPPTDWPRHVSELFYGWGRQMVSDATRQTGTPAGLYRLLRALEAGEASHPGISTDGKTFSLLARGGWENADSVNTMVGQYFSSHVRQKRVAKLRQRLLQAVQQQEKRREKRSLDVTPVDEAEISRLQALGDRLIAAYSTRELPSSPVGGVLCLMDYDGETELSFEIDPSLGWMDNAQTYYRRAKKARARQAAYNEMRDRLEAEHAYHAELRLLIDQADSLATLRQLEEELFATGYLKGKASAKKPDSKKQEKTDELSGIESFTSSDGLTLLVGKSGEGNGKLVGKLARPEDWWLHVHLMPGSHVLIKSDHGDIPNQTLLEAANLAVYFSSARHSLNVPVIYTESRYVRKIPGSYPGHVNYRNERTVFITPDPDVLAVFIPNPDLRQPV